MASRLKIGDPVIYRRLDRYGITHPAFLVDGSVGTLVDAHPESASFIVKFEGYGVISCPPSSIHLNVNLTDPEEVEAWLSHP